MGAPFREIDDARRTPFGWRESRSTLTGGFSNSGAAPAINGAIIKAKEATVSAADLAAERAAKAVAHQPRHIAGVVNVRVGQHHPVDGRGFLRQAFPIAAA